MAVRTATPTRPTNPFATPQPTSVDDAEYDNIGNVRPPERPPVPAVETLPRLPVEEMVAVTRAAYARLGIINISDALVRGAVYKLLAIVKDGGSIEDAICVVEWSRMRLDNGEIWGGLLDLEMLWGRKYALHLGAARIYKTKTAQREDQRLNNGRLGLNKAWDAAHEEAKSRASKVRVEQEQRDGVVHEDPFLSVPS